MILQFYRMLYKQLKLYIYGCWMRSLSRNRGSDSHTDVMWNLRRMIMSDESLCPSKWLTGQVGVDFVESNFGESRGWRMGKVVSFLSCTRLTSERPF